MKNSKLDSVITINKVKDEPERMLTINKKKIISNYLKKKNFSFISRQKLKQKFRIIKKSIVKNFYNDTFLNDQNACTTPHLIIWLGKG